MKRRKRQDGPETYTKQIWYLISVTSGNRTNCYTYFGAGGEGGGTRNCWLVGWLVEAVTEATEPLVGVTLMDWFGLQ